MSVAVAEGTIEAAGTRTRVLQGGPMRDPVLFVHGGAPGVTLFCGGAHIWAPLLPLFAAARRVVAPDLPGFGETPAPAEGASVMHAAHVVLALIESIGLGPCHIVGHDEGGAIALAAAITAPAKIRAVSVIAGAASAPSGDSPERIVLAHPPRPLWTRASQRWALERLSFTPHHITPEFLDRCVAAAEAAPHRAAVSGKPGLAGMAEAKGRLYALCRDTAFPVPVQLVWGRHDPLVTVEQGLALFQVIASRQIATQFHVVNRTGYLPFREAPEACHALIGAFLDGLAADA